MKLTTFLLFTLTCSASFAQLRITNPDIPAFPKNIHYIGKIINAVKWSDNSGENIVITTETGVLPGKSLKEENYRDAALYAYHYILQGDSARLTWKVYDYNKECPVDLELYFIDKTFAVTDLDKNGFAEIWMMYKNGCHGDVSPVPTKIIMYEGGKKYVLRGESKVKVSGTAYLGGKATLDYNFKNGNPAFRQYAENLWKQNQLEKWYR